MSEELNNGTGMVEEVPAAFEPITTQEDLNKVIGERITRERSKYEGFEEYKSKAEKFDAFEESRKTEMQKMTERLEIAEKENAEYKQREQLATWANEVSKEYGIPADVIKGADKEEMMAHAERLKVFTGALPTAPIVQSDGQKPKHKAATTADLFAETVGDHL